MTEFKAVEGGFEPNVGSLHSWTEKDPAPDTVMACEYRPPFIFEGVEYPNGGFLYIDENGDHRAADAPTFTAKYGNVR